MTTRRTESGIYDLRLALARFLIKRAPSIGLLRNLIDPRAPHYSKA